MSLATAMTNAAANDRINIKADGTYSIASPGATISSAGPIFWRGYTSTAGDGGKATISGATTGASYTPITVSASGHQFQDLIFTENGSSGASTWFSVTVTKNVFIRCVFHDVRSTGFVNSNVIVAMVECEAYNCNESNTGTSNGGLGVNLSGSTLIRTTAHDNTAGDRANGIVIDGGVLVYRNVLESNTGHGYYSTGDTTATIIYNNFYNNTKSGLYSANTTDMLMTSASNNWLNNTRYGVEFSSATSMMGTWLNNAYGSGTQANDLGDIQAMEGMQMIGAVAYASDVTPWADPANGDFKTTLTAAKGAGRGLFLQTVSGYSGTIGYPDIGAAQHNE